MCGWGKAEELGPRGIGGGEARAILDAGGTFTQLLRAGQWHFSAYRSYLNLGIGEKQSMASIFFGASDDEGPGRTGRGNREEIP